MTIKANIVLVWFKIYDNMIVGMYMRTYYGNMIELLIYDNTSACIMALIPIVISKVITRILLQHHK